MIRDAATPIEDRVSMFESSNLVPFKPWNCPVFGLDLPHSLRKNKLMLASKPRIGKETDGVENQTDDMLASIENQARATVTDSSSQNWPRVLEHERRRGDTNTLHESSAFSFKPTDSIYSSSSEIGITFEVAALGRGLLSVINDASLMQSGWSPTPPRSPLPSRSSIAAAAIAVAAFISRCHEYTPLAKMMPAPPSVSAVGTSSKNTYPMPQAHANMLY